MIDLNGKVAIVTGSSRGIGKGCAIEMAKCGANIAVNYRSHSEDAHDVAKSIRSFGSDAIVVQGDVSDRRSVDNLVEETISRFGQLDIVVCNAYFSKREPFLEISQEGIDRTIAVSLMGSFHMAQEGAKQFVKQGQGGSILFISSILAFIPVPRSLSYNMSKAGMNHMALTMARELAPHRIRVNVIEPGWIDTPGERQFSTEEEILEGGNSLPWGRLGTIEDIGKPAAFLSSQAADYITGSVLRVDGGFSLEHKME